MLMIPATTLSPFALCAALPLQWQQSYDPTHHWWLSTLFAALPLLALLIALLGLRMKAHLSALVALAVAIIVALGLFHMPVGLASLATLYGAAYGLFPVFWIIFPVIFLYQLTIRAGRFQLLQDCLVGVTEDSRLQLLLIAFAFGAFFEGASGFGTPVAVCGTILIGLGFAPLEAAGLALLANTAPVAFGALGTPVIALGGVTGLNTLLLTRVIAALLTPFCVIVPFWLIWAYAGFKRMIEIWPAILLTGVTFALTQLLMATFHGPWLVDITASVVTIAVLVLFLRFWRPKTILTTARETVAHRTDNSARQAGHVIRRAALPWVILAVFVTIWGSPSIERAISAATTLLIPVPGLNKVVFRMPPAVPTMTAEAAVFNFNWLSATGTGILIAAIIAALLMKLKPKDIVEVFGKAAYSTRFTMITIASLMGLGFLTRFCGLDATLGLAFARTGVLYPFFGTMIGWLGTASTGSDTSSNVLFGSLQKLTAQQLNISPYLMTGANSGGGVMGKMVAPQSVVVASTATGCYGKEGSIIRFVILHSLALTCLMGLLVSLVVYSPTLTKLLLQ
ncbi:L-lactate permease [Granulicella sp. WH15]|uniref:L-lactate permease n=1 Tax=Granulicella sp. WH15 TaxID=2602070 RepID=UPI001C7069CF|nr:L-lactate permease [Granulicella sp. WH15]